MKSAMKDGNEEMINAKECQTFACSCLFNCFLIQQDPKKQSLSMPQISAIATVSSLALIV